MVVSERARGELELSAYPIFVRPVIAEIIFDLNRHLVINSTDIIGEIECVPRCIHPQSY